jgi:hypothetical protein
VQQYSLNIQHQFAGNNLVTAGYVGSLGRHLGQYLNLNYVPVGAGTQNAPGLAGQSGCTAQGVCNVQNTLIHNLAPTIFFVPYQGYSTIGFYQNEAISNYNALQATFRHTVGHGLTFDAVYTWSHTFDDSSEPGGITDGGGIGSFQNLSRWYGNSIIDLPQTLVFDYVYNLPFLKNSSNSLLKNTLGGWTWSGITAFMNGFPVDFTCGVSGFSTGIGSSTARCNTVGNLKVQKGTVDDSQFGPTPTWFDPSVVTQPNFSQLAANNQPGMFGYMGKNMLFGPGLNKWDISLFKNITLPWVHGENSNLRIRLETFNTFNHPSFSSINAGCASTIGFGQPCTQLGNGEVSGDHAPRNIQLGMEFRF